MNFLDGHKTPRADNGGTLVVMAKAPRPGMVKTRLAQSLSLEAVTELYRCLFFDTLDLARSLGTVEVAIMSPEFDVEELSRLVQGQVNVVPQHGKGLAAGLTSVFAHFAVPCGKKVVAFNSDSPHLPAAVLLNAFEVLTTYDVVVGPTSDGGYYLIGAKAAHPALFEHEGMGTGNALEALLARTRALQLSVGFTEPFYDIDLQEDLTRLTAELRPAPARAPRTAAWLQRWDQTARPLTGAADL